MSLADVIQKLFAEERSKARDRARLRRQAAE